MGSRRNIHSVPIKNLVKVVNSELVVDVQPKEISIALLEDGRLVEMNKEVREQVYAVGNIYYGRVKKIMPGLNAAFVDIGYGKDAFLHYLDLGSTFNTLYNYTLQAVSDKKRMPLMTKAKTFPDLEKNGMIGDVLKVGQELLVQVAKEPISTKGPRLTAEISIAGRYLVLIPFAEKVSVSSKINSEQERARLRQLVQSVKPKGYGVIVRTVAEDKKVAELDNELRVLVKRWEDSVAKLQKAPSVSLITEEIGRTIGIIRDLFNPTFDHIYVNEETVYQEIKDYIGLIAPESQKIVSLYNGELSIFDNYAITKQLKTGFGKTVSFKNGAYLIIEHTEALHVIDVNSGNRSKAGNDQEANAFEVNMAAAEEIAHQLRLRDMGGIVVIDFIDMHTAEHKQELYDRMRELMEHDRAKHNILPLSKFGLMQITRQRVRPVIDVDVTETCPVCHGKGKIQPSVLFTDELEHIISDYVEKFGSKIVLYVHPYVYAYITKGWLRTIKRQWQRKYGKIHIVPSQSLGFLDYKFYDRQHNELNLEETMQKA